MSQRSTLEHLLAAIDAGGGPATRASAEDAGVRISYLDQRTVPAAADSSFCWICLSEPSYQPAAAQQ
jgi:hypothetical protein